MSRANIFEPDLEPDTDNPPGFRIRGAEVGHQAGSHRLGASLYELPHGEALCPYHWHEANEEMAIVLSGRPSIRTPAGWRELEPGELVSFPRGRDGAHQVMNRGDETARVLMVSEMNAPELVVYPDSNKAGVRSRAPGSARTSDEILARFRFEDAVDYWEGEPPPGPD
jgi:uncharacterized cupin superfamily protein